MRTLEPASSHRYGACGSGASVAITAWISSKVYVCMYVEQAVEYSSETIVGVTETENKNKNKTETETKIEQRAVCGDAVTRRA